MRSPPLISCITCFALIIPTCVPIPAPQQLYSQSPTITIELFNVTPNKTDTWTTQRHDLVIFRKFDPNKSANVEGSDMLKIICTAPYPVSMEYKGIGDYFPRDTTSEEGVTACGDITKTETCIPTHYKRITCSPLVTWHTGKYVCNGRDSPQNKLTTSFILLVEGDTPFVKQEGMNIVVDKWGSETVIPCVANNPNTTLTLVKAESSGVRMATFPKSSYIIDPGVGIRLVPMQEARYLCLASTRNNTYVEYFVKRKNENCPGSCPNLGTTCWKDSNKQDWHECRCGESLQPTLVQKKTKCIRSCETDSDCPENLNCRRNGEKFKSCVNPCYSANCVDNKCKVEETNFPVSLLSKWKAVCQIG